MKDLSRTKQELIEEISILKKKNKKLEESDAKRKQAEEKLLNIMYEQQIILDNANVGISMIKDRKLIWVNRKTEDMFQYSKEELEGQSTRKFYPSNEAYEQVVKDASLVLGKGQIYKTEQKLIRRDGTPILVKYNSRAIEPSDLSKGTIWLLEDISDLKKAEDALQQKAQQLRDTADKIPGVVYQFYAQPDGKIGLHYVSESSHKIFGLNSDRADFFQRFSAMIAPECLKSFTDSITEAVTTVKPWRYEGRFIKDSGESIWFLGLSNPVTSEREILFNGVMLDVTERKRAEEKLRESEEKYRWVMDNITDVVTVMDMNMRYTYVSPSIIHMRGVTAEEAMTQSVEQYMTPDALQISVQTLEEELKLEASGTADPGRTRFLEMEQYRKDGSTFLVEVSTSFMRDDEQKPVGFIAVSRDITKRKKAEDALKESEEKFRSVVEKSSVGIAILDDAFHYAYVNEEFCNISGYMEQELLGKNFTFPVAEESKAMVAERYQRRQRGEDVPAQYEFTFVRKNGDNRLGEVRSAIYLDSAGKAKSIIQVIDITSRKQAEEEKRILEERLQQADKMESIGTLAGGIAHDFNNLLTGIQGYASLTLMNLKKNDPNYQRLQRIQDQVQSGGDLTGQLLGFARGGRYEVKPTDMNDVIKKSSSMFGRTKKEISIHRKSGKDLWTVEVDRGQMEQVFLNLYVNAWQAMPGGGDIYLETDNIILTNEQAFPYAITPGRYVKITVTDTGTGMDEKTREKIFEPFFTTKAMGRGTGLGLASVYGIIKGHQGMINVYSEPGHGTTFTIYLPSSEKEVIKENKETGEIVRGTETILLVDDEKIVLEVNKELLVSMGYNVFAVGSGQEAVAIFMENKDKIDLVILDMILPGISGADTFDRLREISSGIKVLLSSGYSLNGKAQAIMERGCNGFLQKPFQIEQLSSKVREMLKG
jgi:two-component system cell cycle sensor histidine kinase/response regulator CckA